MIFVFGREANSGRPKQSEKSVQPSLGTHDFMLSARISVYSKWVQDFITVILNRYLMSIDTHSFQTVWSHHIFFAVP